MSLQERLHSRPVLLEVIPPGARARPPTARKFAEKYVQPAEDRLSLDGVNLPEIVEENHRGEPYYKNLDPREFAVHVRETCGDLEVVVNKIVVHFEDGIAGLEAWARETRDTYDIRNVVAVGGTSSKIVYPGPSVAEANRVLDDLGLLVGNIMIPEREGEAHRMVAKTQAGARYFTTQVIFSAAEFLRVLREYQSLCNERGVPPATVFASFAPVSDPADVGFLRWLGVNLDASMEARLLENGSTDPATSSVQVAVRNWRRVLDEQAGYDRVPLGLNVEYINRHNFEPALKMAGQLIRENGH